MWAGVPFRVGRIFIFLEVSAPFLWTDAFGTDVQGAATFRGRTVSPAQPLALGPAAANRHLRTFLLGVAGVDYANLDGSSRQKIIKRCRRGEPMVLVCEPFNIYDRLAVAVRRRTTAERIGYLPRGHGLERLVEQCRVEAKIFAVGGGTWSVPSRKVTLEITVLAAAPKPAPKDVREPSPRLTGAKNASAGRVN